MRWLGAVLVLVGCTASMDFRIERKPVDSVTSILCPVFRFKNGAETVRSSEREVCGVFVDSASVLPTDAQQREADAACFTFTQTDTVGHLLILPDSSCDEKSVR